MHGYRILFFTQENRKVQGKPVGEWLLDTARKLGAKGGTMTTDSLGFGHSGKMHSAGFFELADRPITVSITTDQATCDALMAAIAAEHVDLFYCRSAVEFGRLDGGAVEEG